MGLCAHLACNAHGFMKKDTARERSGMKKSWDEGSDEAWEVLAVAGVEGRNKLTDAGRGGERQIKNSKFDQQIRNITPLHFFLSS